LYKRFHETSPFWGRRSRKSAGAPPLADGRDEHIHEQMPPQRERSGQSAVSSCGTLFVEGLEEVISITAPEFRRVQIEEEGIEPFHDRLFFSFGFVRA
jgi:hypothetical protein